MIPAINNHLTEITGNHPHKHMFQKNRLADSKPTSTDSERKTVFSNFGLKTLSLEQERYDSLPLTRIIRESFEIPLVAIPGAWKHKKNFRKHE
jgi:hypothetical protein